MCVVEPELAVEPQEAPGLDVAGGHELGEASRSVTDGHICEPGAEHGLAPVAVKEPALIGHGLQRRRGVLSCQQAQDLGAVLLVVFEQDGHYGLEITGGGRRALIGDQTCLVRGGGAQKALLGAELAQHGAHCDSCPRGDVVEGYLGLRTVPEGVGGGGEDGIGCRLRCGLSALHRVGPRIHVTDNDMNTSSLARGRQTESRPRRVGTGLYRCRRPQSLWDRRSICSASP